ncbi:MAG: endonuclease/exonuclease/phosphatase family protein [Candidatus Binatia bacterium]
MIQIILSLATAALLAGTIIPLIRVDSVWVRAFDFPRSQIVALGVVVGGAWLAIDDGNVVVRLAIGSLGVCLLYQMYRIWPYTRLHTLEVQQSAAPAPTCCVSLLMANVLMENRNIEPFMSIVERHRPDLVLTVETDHWWIEQLSARMRDYPHRVLHPQDNHYGMALFSRLRLLDSEVRFLVEDDIPSIHAQVQLAGGDLICLHGLHPQPPLPYPQIDSTGRDAELVVVGRAVKAHMRPAVVAGDLNDVAWSHTTRLFQRLSGLLDPRIGRGMYNTFHASYPWLRWPLDHVFHSRHFRLVDLKRCAAFGSDHFPVYIKLSYVPENHAAQSKPVETIEEHVEADVTIYNAEEMTGRAVESPFGAEQSTPSSQQTSSPPL